MTKQSQFLRLVYASRAKFPSGSDEASINADVARILMQSRKNNPANNLVGALYFADGCFFQCLEGPTEAVDGLYARLHHDARHSDLKVLSRTKIDQPSFSRWSMKFVPNAAIVRQLLSKHRLTIFDPYTFTPALLADFVALLLQNSEAAAPEELITRKVAAPSHEQVAMQAKTLAMIALGVSMLALVVAFF